MKHQITKRGMFLDLGDDFSFSLLERRKWIEVGDLSFFNCQMSAGGGSGGG